MAERVTGVWAGEAIEGDAFLVGSLASKRLSVGYTLGEINRTIIRNELADIKTACDQGSECTARVRSGSDDAGYPSHVTFECPTAAEGCTPLVSSAAENTETQVEIVTSKVQALAQAQLGRLQVPTADHIG